MTPSLHARKSAFSISTLLSFALLAGGCTVGPNFHRPANTVPDAWLTPRGIATAMSETTAPSALARWWEVFGDPQLTGLVERGIRSNLDVELAVQRIAQSRAVVGESQSGFWPTLNANGSMQRTYTFTPRSKSPTGAQTKTPTTVQTKSTQAGLDAAWELDLFGGVRRQVEASRADLAVADANLRDALVTLTAEVGVDYMDLRNQQEQLRTTRDNLVIQDHSTSLTSQLQAAGFSGLLDVRNAQAQAASTRAQIPPLEAAIRQDIYKLSLLLGEEPGALVAELTPEGRIPAEPREVPAGIPSDLLRRRPDIYRAEEQLHGATARIGVAVADYFPKFTLNGSGSLQASALGFSGPITRSGAFGPSATWNLFNGGLTWFKVKEQRSLADQAMTTYRQTVLTALQEVESAWTAFDHEVARRADLEEAATRNRQALVLANDLYREGQNDYLSVLVVERSLLSAETALVQSRAATANDLVALYKALGGGWDPDAPAAGQPLAAAASSEAAAK